MERKAERKIKYDLKAGMGKVVKVTHEQEKTVVRVHFSDSEFDIAIPPLYSTDDIRVGDEMELIFRHK